MSKWPQNKVKVKTGFGELTRSQLMSRIRSKGNLTTEITLAKMLRKENITGWRRNIGFVGNPDFAFYDRKTVIFVDGCFWHGHGCGRNLTPKNNRKKWAEKFAKNQKRDRSVNRKLRESGWTVVRIWECALAKNPRAVINRIKRKL